MASMLFHMRTTIQMDEALARQVKQYAARHGLTVTQVIQDSLRATLARRPRPATRAAERLTTVGGDGLLPGVDLDDSAGLLDLLERGHDAP